MIIRCIRRFFFCFIIGIAVIGLFSCDNYRGYGVLLLNNEAFPFTTGELLPVTDIYRVDNYYEVTYNGELYQVPMWQMEYSQNKDEAIKFQDVYKPFAEMYVFTKKYDGLPIREKPDSMASMIYRIRPGQTVKVLGRSKDQVQIGALTGYWYWLITDEGLRGYSFGYHLEVIEGAENLSATVSGLLEEDSLMEKLMTNTWRPVEMARMIESGRIDLSTLEKNYLLTPKSDQNIVSIVNEDIDKDFSYTEIKKTSADTYSFEGADLRIQVLMDDKIRVSYYFEDLYVTREFVLVASDIGDVVRGEQDRRHNLLLAFINKGGVLSSGSYGTITLSSDYRFNWASFGSLKGLIIPSQASGSGSVNFSSFIGRGVSGNFDGAITFVFDEAAAQPVTFVYNFQGRGVRFMHVPVENIKDSEIRQLGPSPLVMIFNFSQ